MKNAEQLVTEAPVKGGPTLVVVSKKQTIDPLDVVSFGKSAKQHIHEFACIIAIACYVIAGIKMYKTPGVPADYYWIAFGTAFLLLGYIAPRAMMPIWKGWMKFAVGLGMIMSTILVSIAWVLMFWPVGILFKIIGKRTMDLSYKAPVSTYWETRDEKLGDFKLLERQF